MPDSLPVDQWLLPALLVGGLRTDKYQEEQIPHSLEDVLLEHRGVALHLLPDRKMSDPRKPLSRPPVECDKAARLCVVLWRYPCIKHQVDQETELQR